MKNKCLAMGLYPASVDPITHKTFRGTCFTKNGTLNGAYTRELTMALEWVINVFEGKLEVVDIVDHEARLLLTHTLKDEKTYIFRKNERTDLTELAIHNVNISLLKRIKHILIDHYATKYGSLSSLVNQAMDLYVKVKNRFVKLVETGNKPLKSFISDEEGQFSSVEGNSILRVFESLTSRVIELQNDIKEIKESTVQSTSNISSKVGRKVKNVVNGNGKSGKVKAKLDKSERILNNLKKRYEHRFTNKEYGEPLAKLTGQGDNRTVRSDLETLEGAGLIKKVRSSANGVKTYEFTENTEYYKYNSDLGKTKFFDDFKEKFSDQDALTMDDLNKFILEKYELFDAQSQNKRLRWLLAEGLVRRHEVNPKLLFIQK